MSSETPTTQNDDTVQEQTSDAELLQLVSFVVGTEEYAIPILAVQEINRMMPITRVPQSPEFVEGVINLRGRVIPVVDLRRRFDIETHAETGDERIIVVEIGGAGEARVLGFTVDRVNRVLRISRDIVEPAPTITSGIDSDFVEGVGKLEEGLLILLSLEKLFSEEELGRACTTATKAA